MKTPTKPRPIFESFVLAICLLVAGIMLGYAWASWHWQQSSSYLDWQKLNHVRPIQLNRGQVNFIAQVNLVHKMNNLG